MLKHRDICTDTCGGTNDTESPLDTACVSSEDLLLFILLYNGHAIVNTSEVLVAFSHHHVESKALAMCLTAILWSSWLRRRLCRTLCFNITSTLLWPSVSLNLKNLGVSVLKK
jgi:hypothetical protein